MPSVIRRVIKQAIEWSIFSSYVISGFVEKRTTNIMVYNYTPPRIIMLDANFFRRRSFCFYFYFSILDTCNVLRSNSIPSFYRYNILYHFTPLQMRVIRGMMKLFNVLKSFYRRK